MSTDVTAAASTDSLLSLTTDTRLRWCFVGGKGGVGKTTTSCCLGIQLARVRKNVLIVSTDPAHNLSDAFGQKFSRTPTKVAGYDNLFCMEIDPNVEAGDSLDVAAVAAAAGAPGGGGAPPGIDGVTKFMKELAGNIPGIDEVMSFAELMKLVQQMEFDVTVFDTAPTGHTLRLLAMPTMLDKALSSLMGLRSSFGPAFAAMSGLMGGAASGLPSQDAILGKLDELKATVDAVQARIHNPDETTFVCVCIPEFLSLYETERLVQELAKFDIDTHCIVVNQVLMAGVEGAGGGHAGDGCGRCVARTRMQAKYLSNIAGAWGARGGRDAASRETSHPPLSPSTPQTCTRTSPL